MRRLPRTHKKLAMEKDAEPDFYELEKTAPLPTLEEAAATLEIQKVKRIREQLAREQEAQAAQAAAAARRVFMLPPR